MDKEIKFLDEKIKQKEEEYRKLQADNSSLLEELKIWEEKVKKVESYLL